MKKILMLLAAMTTSSAVQALDFKVLADRNADFRAINTFAMGDVKIIRASGAKVKQANIDNLRDAVKKQLEEEGYRLDESNPDVRVSVLAGVDAGEQPANVQVEPYFDGAWRVLPKAGGEEAPAQPMTYNQATLRIDIKNVKSGQVIWRAEAKDVIRLPVTRAFMDANLHLIFEQFPPPEAK